MPKKISPNAYILDYIMYETDLDILLQKLSSFHTGAYSSGKFISNLRSRPLRKRYDKYVGICYSTKYPRSIWKSNEKEIGIFLPLENSVALITLKRKDNGNIRVFCYLGKGLNDLEQEFNKKTFTSLHRILKETKEGQ